MRTSIVALVLVASVSCFAGEQRRPLVVVRAEDQQPVTGNLNVDFFGQKNLLTSPQMENQTESAPEMHHKSPWLAAGLSFVVPGAGEVYADNYWKAAIFLAADVAFWALAASNNKKGNDQTAFFENYANQRWSAKKYAQFALDHFVTDPAERARYQSTLFKQGSTPWDQVNWNVLNEMEREISATAEGKYYSHTLPPYGEQQYFELIGKYQQFYQGWDDADPGLTSYDQIDARLASGYSNLTYYAGERGKANDFYTRATTFVTIAVINHVLSAVDAAWTASTYNHNLHASVRYQSVPVGFGFAQVPAARVEFSF
jgi:hypothetical protein